MDKIIKDSYVPTWLEDCEFFFTLTPGQPPTLYDPSYPDEIEIYKITVNNNIAKDALFDLIFEAVGDKIENEISDLRSDYLTSIN